MPQRRAHRWWMIFIGGVLSFVLNSDVAFLVRGATAGNGGSDWDALYRKRLDWWSLQPLSRGPLPEVADTVRVRNDVDRFVLAGLERRGLTLRPEADRLTLARRLCFALTGLPPSVEAVKTFATDASPEAYERLVGNLLASPQFGEHWARHWMDIVHYADTHGYEWDVPAKNAWRYRDYLVRAFNRDVPIRRLLLEQIAGDLLDPRVDPATGINESLVGPMALRLGERRHGDNAAAEGVTQEAIANVVDTVGKAFLGTTLACAQCHDHKLDAVGQRDFYALAGVFMSTRWHPRCIDAVDPNEATLAELRRIKSDIRSAVASEWSKSSSGLAKRIRAMPIPTNAAVGEAIPTTLNAFWQRSQTNPPSAEQFLREHERRVAANRTNLHVLADLTQEGDGSGWRWEGFGMKHGLVRDGECVVASVPGQAIESLLPAGRWSHVWSKRLAGAVRSPLFDPATITHFSVGHAAGMHAAESMIVDHAFHCERMRFLNQPRHGWLTLAAGNFDTLEGGIDRVPRRVYVEFVTKSLNNYFPPRTGYGGVTEADADDERSWFGVTRVYAHPQGKPPLDELGRFVPLFVRGADQQTGDWADRLANLVSGAVERWARDAADAECVALLNDALASGWLPNDTGAWPDIARLVDAYHAVERRLQPDQTVGSVSDWSEARNERMGIRGSYTDLGEEVPRGVPRLLGDRSVPAGSPSCGRLELALQIAGDANPLTARVFVNRVWLYLFGDGLVRTPDDFGHLGERPAQPELLDHLAARFVAEGWSLKRLITVLVSSATWRQDGRATAAALEVDPENRLWHHLPMRRLEAESIRDALLTVSGRLDPRLGGLPLDPPRVATDAAKRLFSGPLDGDGRRSLYTKMTLMEPPRFLALFNQPIPKLTTGRRDMTSVPDQALALMNDPFVVAMARHWAERVVTDGSDSPAHRIERMFSRAFSRSPRPEEVARIEALAARSARMRGVDSSALLACEPVWQDVAHALFNLKEFIHVQ